MKSEIYLKNLLKEIEPLLKRCNDSYLLVKHNKRNKTLIIEFPPAHALAYNMTSDIISKFVKLNIKATTVFNQITLYDIEDLDVFVGYLRIKENEFKRS